MNNKRTVLCEHWQRGYCRNGTRCNFAHGATQLRRPEAKDAHPEDAQLRKAVNGDARFAPAKLLAPAQESPQVSQEVKGRRSRAEQKRRKKERQKSQASNQAALAASSGRDGIEDESDDVDEETLQMQGLHLD
eukprot:Skav221158  [mRNA]  locus=scaffold85:98102:98640:- [translate_table: standard]